MGFFTFYFYLQWNRFLAFRKSCVLGFILNEIFRRIEPSGKTLGEYLKSEIAEPLGADVNLGVLDKDLDRIHDVTNWSIPYAIYQCMWPAWTKRKTEVGFSEFYQMVKMMKSLDERKSKRAERGIPKVC